MHGDEPQDGATDTRAETASNASPTALQSKNVPVSTQSTHGKDGAAEATASAGAGISTADQPTRQSPMLSEMVTEATDPAGADSQTDAQMPQTATLQSQPPETEQSTAGPTLASSEDASASSSDRTTSSAVGTTTSAATSGSDSDGDGDGDSKSTDTDTDTATVTNESEEQTTSHATSDP
ncbi:hypothetical protein LPJ75_007359, partial [Coemansia sp. RSA 2598]